MIRAVIDTNILISALLSAQGAPAQILRMEREGRIELVFSPDTVQEHWRVLHYRKIEKRLEKLHVPLATVEQFLMNLVKASTLVPGTMKVDAIEADPSDDIFLACAIEGQANFIISGDHHLLELGTFQGIQIVEPATFVNDYE